MRNIRFVILPGFSPDALPVASLRDHLRSLGYAAESSNFWGADVAVDLKKLSLADCRHGVASFIEENRRDGDVLVGIGISLGGALFLEYAKEYTGLDFIVSVGTPFRLKKRRQLNLARFLSPVVVPIWAALGRFKRARFLPVGAMVMVMDFLRGDFLLNLESIRTPVLLMHSKKDDLSDYAALLEYMPRLTATTVATSIFEDRDHVIGYDHDLIVSRILGHLPEEKS